MVPAPPGYPRWHPDTARSTRRFAVLVSLVALAACGDAPTESLTPFAAAPAFSHTSTHQVYTSGSDVTAWDAIIPAVADPNWTTTICTSQPQVGRNAAWQNPHNAYVLSGHPWAYDYFIAPWINAWNSLGSVGPSGQNWTKYQTSVSGNGSFVIRLLADNCSWIYLDGTLVGVQGTNLAANSYGLTLNGTHSLEFIIFDGGGAAGGKFLLETTTNPPPPLNPDLDGDGHNNDVDAFPLDPTRWSLDGDGDGVSDDVDNCPAASNADQADYDNDGVGDACDPDIDGDGVANGPDAFPYDPNEWADSDGDGFGDNADQHDNSNTGPEIVVRTCNTGVANWHIGQGTWANDLIADAYASSANHGAFVSAVTRVSNGWKKAGLITGREHGAIVSCAARSK